MKTLVKKLAHMLLGEYSAYYIYTLSTRQTSFSSPPTHTQYRVELVDESTVACNADPLIREQSGYAGSGSHAYACFDNERIVGICFYWFGNRYLKRNFWPLAEWEAKLVQIIVHPEMRGRGVATLLIASSFQDMVHKGYNKVYARIWHSNTPSLRAFERAGWTRIALVVEINPLRRKRAIRLNFTFKSARDKFERRPV